MLQPSAMSLYRSAMCATIAIEVYWSFIELDRVGQYVLTAIWAFLVLPYFFLIRQTGHIVVHLKFAGCPFNALADLWKHFLHLPQQSTFNHSCANARSLFVHRRTLIFGVIRFEVFDYFLTALHGAFSHIHPHLLL